MLSSILMGPKSSHSVGIRTTLWAFAWRQLSEEDLFGYPVVLHGTTCVCTTTQSICLVTDCDGSARVWYLWKHGTTHECHTAAANTHIYRVCFRTCFPSFFEAPQTLHSLSGFCIVAAGGISAGKWCCVSLLGASPDVAGRPPMCRWPLWCRVTMFSVSFFWNQGDWI